MVAMLVMTACGQKEDKTGKDKNSMEGENNITATTTTGVEPTKAAETTPTSEATPTLTPGGDGSGELLQDPDDLEGGEQGDGTVDMDKVTEVLCPSAYTDKKPGVTYDTVMHFTYYSETTGCERGANILLPADYDKDRKYPVLYFLHGIFGDENSMIKDANCRITEIVGNLKAEGIIGDVIIVFPHMYATGDPNLKPGFTLEQTLPYDNFINDLTNDLMPYVEKTYGAMTDRENRGIIGFSMGGRETLFIGVTRSDLFAYITAIAPAPGVTPGKDWAMAHPGQLTEDELVIHRTDYMPELLMVCCGTKDSVVGKFPLSYHNIMTKNEVKHVWYEVPGADHDANAIKSGLYNFLIRWKPGK